MKKLLTLTLLTTLYITFPTVTFAHGDESDGHHETEKAKTADVNPSDSLIQIKQAYSDIDALAKAGKLSEIHARIELVEPYLDSIAKTEVAAEKKTRLAASVKQVRSQLDKVHEVSDANDAVATEAELKKLNGAILLLESSLK